jgi:GxxExxY protein
MNQQNRLLKTPYDGLTYKIIGCAMDLHCALGSHYKEKIYQKGLEARFSAAGLAFVAEQPLEVYDDLEGGLVIGYYIPDFVVEEKVVVEIKALKGLDNSHLAQVICYLAVTGCPLGLLINFGERSLKHRRVLPPKDIGEHRVNRQWLFVPDWLKPEHPSETELAKRQKSV